MRSTEFYEFEFSFANGKFITVVARDLQAATKRAEEVIGNDYNKVLDVRTITPCDNKF